MSLQQKIKNIYGFDFPKDFFQFYEFAQRLNLISARIEKLFNLELLDLSRNQLRKMPFEITKLGHLKWVRLQKNHFISEVINQYEKQLSNVKITY